MLNSQSFGSEDQAPIILALVDRGIKDPEKIIDSIKFRHFAPGRTLNRLDRLLGFVLECRVYEWLRGRGFVDHETVRALLTPEELEDGNTDPSARARLFLAGVSQSGVPPVRNLNITVSLTLAYDL